MAAKFAVAADTEVEARFCGTALIQHRRQILDVAYSISTYVIFPSGFFFQT